MKTRRISANIDPSFDELLEAAVEEVGHDYQSVADWVERFMKKQNEDWIYNLLTEILRGDRWSRQSFIRRFKQQIIEFVSDEIAEVIFDQGERP